MYAQAVRFQQRFPAKFGYFLAAWVYVCTSFNSPQPGMREISMEEWSATPADYLRHPDMHPKHFGKFPGDSPVENKREQLFKKYGQPDPSPSHPAAGSHGHH
jgi:hypothetical protein